MAKYFVSNEVESSFLAWINIPTFNTPHSTDVKRWNEFVLCALNHDEPLQHEFIYNELKEEYGEEEADKLATEYKVKFERLDSFYKLACREIGKLQDENEKLHSKYQGLKQELDSLKK